MVLNVADACSGVNHLISLTAVTIPLAILTQRHIIPALGLIAFSVPVALFSNSLRVVFLILYNYHRVIFEHGPKNILATEFGFFIGLAIMYISSHLLSKLKLFTTPKSVVSQTGPIRFVVSTKTMLALIAVLVVGTLFLNLWKIKDDPGNVPVFNRITSSENITIEIVESIPGLDSLPVADADYKCKITSKNGNYLYAYVGWNKKQTQEKEVAGYLYDRLFDFDRTVTINKTSNMHSFRVAVLKNFWADFHYWITYRSQQAYSSSPVIIKLLSTLDAFVHRSTAASIVILAIPAEESNTFINNMESNTTPLLFDAVGSIEKIF